jgi:hypothetical protein
MNTLDPAERLVTIEDTYELGLDQMPERHRDVVAYQAREANTEGSGRGQPGRAGALGAAHEPGPGDRRRAAARRVRADVQRHEPGPGRVRGHGARLLLRAGRRPADQPGPAGGGAPVPRRPPCGCSARPWTSSSSSDRGAIGTRVITSVREVCGSDGLQLITNEVWRPGPTAGRTRHPTPAPNPGTARRRRIRPGHLGGGETLCGPAARPVRSGIGAGLWLAYTARHPLPPQPVDNRARSDHCPRAAPLAVVCAGLAYAVTGWIAALPIASAAAYFLPVMLGPDATTPARLAVIEAIADVHRDAARHPLRGLRTESGPYPRVPPRPRRAAARRRNWPRTSTSADHDPTGATRVRRPDRRRDLRPGRPRPGRRLRTPHPRPRRAPVHPRRPPPASRPRCAPAPPSPKPAPKPPSA